MFLLGLCCPLKTITTSLNIDRGTLFLKILGEVVLHGEKKVSADNIKNTCSIQVSILSPKYMVSSNPICKESECLNTITYNTVELLELT